MDAVVSLIDDDAPPLRRGIVDPDDWLEDVFRELPALRGFAMSLCRNRSDADDLTQDTLLKAWTYRDKFEPGTHLKAWLFAILRNSWYSTAAKRRREVLDEEGKHAAALVCQGNQEFSLELQALREALDRLPPEYREAVVLVGAAGLSYEQAAEIAGLPLGTLKSRVSRGRRRLLALMDPVGVEKAP